VHISKTLESSSVHKRHEFHKLLWGAAVPKWWWLLTGSPCSKLGALHCWCAMLGRGAETQHAGADVAGAGPRAAHASSSCPQVLLLHTRLKSQSLGPPQQGAPWMPHCTPLVTENVAAAAFLSKFLPEAVLETVRGL
jgi:hypothetical protein